MQEGTNISFKKAVHAARFVIRSRTGVAILKNSYKQKSDPPTQKTAKLLQEINVKEMRKLERDRKQFVIEQSQKVNIEKVLSESSRKSQSSQKTVSQELKDLVNKKTGAQRLRVIDEETCENMKNSTNAVLYRRDFALVPLSEKRSKMAWEQNDIENGENTQENSQTSHLTRKKLLRHNLDFYDEKQSLEIWLNKVEIANLTRKEKSAGKSKKQKYSEQEKDLSSQQQTSFLPNCDDVKSTSQKLQLPKLALPKYCTTENSLKLPKLESSVTPDSSRVKSEMEGSLKDPRFTRLIDSLTPSKKLKLPQIVTKPNSRAS